MELGPRSAGISRAATIALAAVAALAMLWASAAPAPAASLVPPKPRILFGVSDRGSAEEFYDFADLVGKRPALLETFHPWGNSLNKAFERWRETAVRPILHVSTLDDKTLEELITPREIALGEGDDYLLQLNFFFSKHDLYAYVRPLGEPNRCLNPYSAVDCHGNRKGDAHRSAWYKQAFRRISLIVRGGRTLERLNAVLDAIDLPPLNRSEGPDPERLREAPVAIIWSPLPAGAPRVRGNWPGNYWPGPYWVDWVGTDFYSEYPHWRDLNRFFGRPHWRNFPFTLTEWAVSGEDEPRFARRIVAWMVKRPRARMFVYYRGFGEEDNPYSLSLYPRTADALRRMIRRRTIPAYAWRHANTLPPAEEEEEAEAEEEGEAEEEATEETEA